MKALVLQKRLAATDSDSYEQQGRFVHDKLLVPLPKMHKIHSTEDDFGVLDVNQKLIPYCKNGGQSVIKPMYDRELTQSCNPQGFEYVPVARLPTASVPNHFVQIRAVRAQMHKGNTTVCWLGLQNQKYVSLPIDWVNKNIDPIL